MSIILASSDDWSNSDDDLDFEVLHSVEMFGDSSSMMDVACACSTSTSTTCTSTSTTCAVGT